jgi:hypothetical protein
MLISAAAPGAHAPRDSTTHTLASPTRLAHLSKVPRSSQATHTAMPQALAIHRSVHPQLAEAVLCAAVVEQLEASSRRINLLVAGA